MTRSNLTNIADSVRQRLMNRAKETGRPFGEVLMYYAMERFLYRLSCSDYAEQFVLKGALMMVVWQAPHSRPTKDIDLLGQMPNDLRSITGAVAAVCRQPVEPDGVVFDPTSVSAERIIEDADYEGVRVRFRGSQGTARVSMQIDIGFGDIVIPSPQVIDYPTILDQPAPRLRGYSRESVVAEKLEAMIRLGILNSRMKDFFDVWLLSRQFDFDGRILSSAIRQTFSTRATSVPARPLALSDAFIADPAKVAQWRGFVRKNLLEGIPLRLADVIQAVAAFLMPVTEAIVSDRAFNESWVPPGPWQRQSADAS